MFAQGGPGVSPDPAVLAEQARRFFRDLLPAPLGSPGSPGSLEPRAIAVRPATEEVWTAAERAEERTGAAASGLSRLARRCATVMRVACASEDDRGALLLAAVIASVHLGPILDPARERIFGVRTARATLERSSRKDR